MLRYFPLSLSVSLPALPLLPGFKFFHLTEWLNGWAGFCHCIFVNCQFYDRFHLLFPNKWLDFSTSTKTTSFIRKNTTLQLVFILLLKWMANHLLHRLLCTSSCKSYIICLMQDAVDAPVHITQYVRYLVYSAMPHFILNSVVWCLASLFFQSHIVKCDQTLLLCC